jgi:hypothetical protein
MADKLEKTRKKPATKKRAKAKKPAVVKKKKVVQKQNVTQSVKIVIGDSKKRKAPALRRVAAATKTAPPSVPVVNYHRIDIPYYRAVENDRRPAPLFDDSVNRHQTHQARAIVPPDRDPNRDTGNDLLTARDLADFRQDVSRRFGALTQRVAGGLGDVSRHVSRTSYQLGEDLGNLVEDSNRRQTAANPSLTADQVHDVVSYANMVQTQNQPPSLTRADLDEFRETVDLGFAGQKRLIEETTQKIANDKPAPATPQAETVRVQEAIAVPLPRLESEPAVATSPPSLVEAPPEAPLPTFEDPEVTRGQLQDQGAGTAQPVKPVEMEKTKKGPQNKGPPKGPPPTQKGKPKDNVGLPRRSVRIAKNPPPPPRKSSKPETPEEKDKRIKRTKQTGSGTEGSPIQILDSNYIKGLPVSSKKLVEAYLRTHIEVTTKETSSSGGETTTKKLVFKIDGDYIPDFKALMKATGQSADQLKGKLKRAKDDHEKIKYYE